MSNRRYAIIGTGALGGYYGGCLAHAGHDVHFLLRSDHEHVSKHGLRVDSPNGDFTLPRVNAYADPSEMPKCDVVVVALKSTQNAALSEILPTVTADDGVALVLQNGLGVDEQAAALLGDDRVLGGLCFLCSNKVGPGHIRHMDYGRIAMGEFAANGKPGGISDRLREIASDFESAGIEIMRTEHLALARWQKLVWNVPFNGLSVALNAQTDELIRFDATRQLAESIMWEVVRGAKAVLGCEIDSTFVARMIDDTERMKPYRTSMKIDFDEGRPMEVEAIFGEPVRRAAAADCDLPQMRMLYQQLLLINDRLARARAM